MTSLYKNTFYMVGLSYLFTILLIIMEFDSSIRLISLSILLLNIILTCCFYFLIKKNNEQVLLLLIYGVFLVAYVFKGFLQNIFGLNTPYVTVTVRTIISSEVYIQSLYLVGYAHLTLICALIGLSYVPSKHSHSQIKYIKRDVALLGLGVLFLFILLSTLVMKAYGVAIMGSEGVSLPFKLSGIFFYSRLILIPLFLLYCMEKFIMQKNKQLLYLTMFLYVLLAFSEIYVRATKAPVFYMVIQFVILYLLLNNREPWLNVKVKKRYLFLAIVGGLALWPAIEMYREYLLGNETGIEHLTSVSSVFYGAERLFQRVLGFLQFAGLVADGNTYNFSEVTKFKSIGHFYTNHHLGYEMKGHLSSPSLLGVFYMFAGQYGVVLIAAFVFLTWGLWKLTIVFRSLTVPVRCLVSIELINTIIAGTIDFALYNIAIIFLIALLLSASMVILRKVRVR